VLSGTVTYYPKPLDAPAAALICCSKPESDLALDDYSFGREVYIPNDIVRG
jgi:hypothetical protein